jgi:two-component system, sensor histidine kinase SagS
MMSHVDERIRQRRDQMLSGEHGHRLKDELAKVQTPPEAAGRLIVVVEDEQLVAVLASAWLSAAGFDVEAITVDGSNSDPGKRSVERRFEEPLPDAMAINSSMPGMNGDRAARLIREREAATGLPRIPILLTSGYSAGERFPAVVDGFLAKPFTLDQLVSAVIGVGWPSSEGSVRESNGLA